MEHFPIELHHIICSYLHFDNCKDYQNIFNVILNYETLFSIKYIELYPYIKKVIHIDALKIDWKFLNEEFEMVNYSFLLKQHKYNVDTIDDSYDLNYYYHSSTNFLIKDLVYSSLYFIENNIS